MVCYFKVLYFIKYIVKFNTMAKKKMQKKLLKEWTFRQKSWLKSYISLAQMQLSILKHSRSEEKITQHNINYFKHQNICKNNKINSLKLQVKK